MADKYIPIPPRGGGPTRTGLSSGLRGLDVGESIFVPGLRVQTACTTARRVSRGTGAQFTSRSVEENGQKGVRCWRTA